MKILLVDQIATVNYKYTYSLANALKSCGNIVELVIDDKKDNEYCKNKCFNQFLTARKDLGKLEKVKNYCRAYKFLLKKAVEEQFDVVHVQWFPFSPIDYYYIKKMKKNNIQIIITVHDILPFNEKFYDKGFHKKIYKLGSNIIVQAENNMQRFGELFPKLTSKLKFIPHGHFLDFADFYNMKEARRHLAIPEDKKVLLFFGQIKKVKGLGILLEAFGEAVKRHKDLYLVVAGNVWKDDFTAYQNIIEKYSLDDSKLKIDIRFIPNDEVGYYYCACDIAVLPYLDVYQSGVIQLVYAYEKPAIATTLAPFLEIVEDGETGFLCEPNSVQSLEDVILRAFSNEYDINEMGKRGKEFIRSKYSWIEIARKVTALYSGDRYEN
jgi:Glycosyltransferase